MKINKSMEIAKFALAQGRYVTARDMWDLGFRFSRGETTPDNISAVLNKIHESDRIVAKRQVFQEEIDHINHIRDDNRAVNLEKKKHLANGRNKSRAVNNTSGATGVYWHKGCNKWRAAIRVNDVLRHIGNYATFDEALTARKNAEIEHGFHENHGATNG